MPVASAVTAFLGGLGTALAVRSGTKVTALNALATAVLAALLACVLGFLLMQLIDSEPVLRDGWGRLVVGMYLLFFLGHVPLIAVGALLGNCLTRRR